MANLPPPEVIAEFKAQLDEYEQRYYDELVKYAEKEQKKDSPE